MFGDLSDPSAAPPPGLPPMPPLPPAPVGPVPSDGITAWGIAAVVLAAAGGFFAGRAMAPSKQDEVLFGMMGAVAGAFPLAPTLALGVLGAYALHEQDGG